MLHVTPPHDLIVISDEGCWLWTGANDGRYGVKYDREAKRQVKTHRVNYEHLVGPIPEGYEIDHLCREKLCCNPDHLEAVTHRENTLRGNGPSAQQARQTHCKNGHPFSGDNLRITPTGVRRCRTCTREYKRFYYRKTH